MKILIAGARGQLGQALLTPLHSHNLIPLSHAELDITSLNQVKSAIMEHAPDIVINASAYNLVDRAESEPDKAFSINETGPKNLAAVTGEKKIALVHVSTDYVFDGESRRPYNENDEPSPLSKYGASKRAGEIAVQERNPLHYIVRTAWLYSVTGQNFPKKMLSLAKEKEIHVINDQYGSPTYAPHLAEAIAKLIRTTAYGVWHMAGRGEATWFEFTQALYRSFEITTPIVPISYKNYPRVARRPVYSALTSIREPVIQLPPWKEGVLEFAEALRK